MPTATERAIAEIRESKPLAKHAKKILALVRPHIALTPRKGKATDNKLGASRLAGEPDLPDGTAWPIGPGFEGEAPMDFIAQLDLDTISRRDVDGLLPKTGVLAFFVAQNYDGGKVIYGEHDDLVRVTRPATKKGKKPPKWGGFDIAAEMVLPPPWSEMVSSKNRNASAWSSRTGKRGKGKTLVELAPDAHAAYGEIYDRWLEAVGWQQHGLFGYERTMEAVQKADELMLLRIDENRFTAYGLDLLVHHRGRSDRRQVRRRRIALRLHDLMALSDLSDAELEAQFLEAERNALAWAELGVDRASERGSRWMKIAGELRAELQRRLPKRVRR